MLINTIVCYSTLADSICEEGFTVQMPRHKTMSSTNELSVYHIPFVSGTPQIRNAGLGVVAQIIFAYLFGR